MQPARGARHPANVMTRSNNTVLAPNVVPAVLPPAPRQPRSSSSPSPSTSRCAINRRSRSARRVVIERLVIIVVVVFVLAILVIVFVVSGVVTVVGEDPHADGVT